MHTVPSITACRACMHAHEAFIRAADKNPNNREEASTVFKMISEAYEVLSDRKLVLTASSMVIIMQPRRGRYLIATARRDLMAARRTKAAIAAFSRMIHSRSSRTSSAVEIRSRICSTSALAGGCLVTRSQGWAWAWAWVWADGPRAGVHIRPHSAPSSA